MILGQTVFAKGEGYHPQNELRKNIYTFIRFHTHERYFAFFLGVSCAAPDARAIDKLDHIHKKNNIEKSHK